MKVIAFDIETGPAEELHRYQPHDEQGYIRLCGWSDALDPDAPVHISTDPRELLDVLLSADLITGANILNFDLMALAVHVQDVYERLAVRAIDSLLVERHLNPVAARGRQPQGFYTLDATAERYGCAGKMHITFEEKREIARRYKGDKYADRMKPGKTDKFGVLKVLAEMAGGFDRIPLDDPDYVEYLRRDVRASAGVYRKQAQLIEDEPESSQDYLASEHDTAMHMARVTIEGCRVDVNLNMSRLAAGQARLDAAKKMLHERFGMPLEGKKPHVTNPGKAAFRAALLSTGINEEHLDAHWPLNKDGSLSTSKTVLTDMVATFEKVGNKNAAELCRTILAMNGERTIYQTIDTCLSPDGKVHPYIGPDQASGRWSMKDPGLTVFGKRGGKAAERAVILADTDEEWTCAIDADQVDARGIAGLSQDPEYMKLFLPGMDLHSEVAYRVWSGRHLHTPECHEDGAGNCDCGVARKCHCDRRDKAKVFGHGWNYGMQPGTMAAQHGVDIEVARQFDRGMKNGFPRLAEFQDEMRELAGALPFGEAAPAHDSYRILHTGFGRPVRVERERAFTQATALVGQGTTRDIMARAIAGLPPHVRRKVRAVIHDEIVVSIGAEMTNGDLSREAAQAAAQKLADSMAFDFRGVQITFGCSRVSRSWAGCYGEQYEMVA